MCISPFRVTPTTRIERVPALPVPFSSQADEICNTTAYEFFFYLFRTFRQVVEGLKDRRKSAAAGGGGLSAYGVNTPANRRRLDRAAFN